MRIDIMIVIAAALLFAVSSASPNVWDIQPPSNLTVQQDSESSCDTCPNISTLFNINVLIEKEMSNEPYYMFTNLSNGDCCNVVAKHKCDSTDIRGKRIDIY